jgi:uncharacterized protein (TIGR02646 family)
VRFINVQSFSPSAAWLERAKQALQEIQLLELESRHSEINKHRKVWTDLKENLGQLSSKKCWYCESKEIRSDKHVDHFRPKNRVRENGCDAHPGYWWLAFEWLNFRYSCTYCNSLREDETTKVIRGKGDRFPLRDESRRCYKPEDFLSDEQPTLLDPTEPADGALLWFDEDGTARPTTTMDAAPWPYQRAMDSIDIYHFNHTDLKEARLAIANRCRRLVEQGDDSWKEYAQGSLASETKFKKTIEDLTDYISPSLTSTVGRE